MSSKYRVGFCVSGGGKLFRAAVNQAPKLGITPTILVAESRCAANLLEFCQEREIECHNLDARNRAQFDNRLIDLCLGTRLDLLCLTFDRIIPAQLVAHYRGRIINVHMGLLPAFKGLNGLNQAIECGARFAGATIHEVTEDVDAGAIISQCVVAIRQHERIESVGARLFGSLRLMFLQVLLWYAAGRVTKDDRGRIWIRDAVYGELPISPAIEEAFAD